MTTWRGEIFPSTTPGDTNDQGFFEMPSRPGDPLPPDASWPCTRRVHDCSSSYTPILRVSQFEPHLVCATRTNIISCVTACAWKRLSPKACFPDASFVPVNFCRGTPPPAAYDESFVYGRLGFETRFELGIEWDDIFGWTTSVSISSCAVRNFTPLASTADLRACPITVLSKYSILWLTLDTRQPTVQKAPGNFTRRLKTWNVPGNFTKRDRPPSRTIPRPGLD